MMIIVVLVPTKDGIDLITIAAYIVMAYFLLCLLIYFFQPRVLISRSEDKIYINRPFKIYAIDPVSISNVVIKSKSRRAVKYSFGKISIMLKNGDEFTVKNVASLDKVRSDILTFVRKK